MGSQRLPRAILLRAERRCITDKPVGLCRCPDAQMPTSSTMITCADPPRPRPRILHTRSPATPYSRAPVVEESCYSPTSLLVCRHLDFNLSRVCLLALATLALRVTPGPPAMVFTPSTQRSSPPAFARPRRAVHAMPASIRPRPFASGSLRRPCCCR